jgi:hypothetical protein
MRLTLRTLLAYLDDLLEPSQTKEIGAKVNESGYASMLVNRIREVMRRRRLTAPEVSGPGMGLDPNSVAEYLDNTLAPDAVADVEKVCLDSDVHLAEVAASHQILTLVLGEPVDVPSSTRERMYALGPRAKSGSNGRKNVHPEGDSEVRPVTGSGNVTATSAETATSTASEKSFDGTVPDYLKPAPLWKRLGPVAVAAVVGAVWLWLVYFDPSLNNPQPGESEVASTGTQPEGTSSSTDVPAGTPVTPVPEGNTEPPVEETGTSPGQPVSTAIASTGTTETRPFGSLPNYDPDAPPDVASTSKPTEPITTPSTTAPSTAPSGTEVGSAETTTSPGTVKPETVVTTPPGTTKPPVAGTPSTAPVAKPATTPAVAPVLPAPEVVYLSREGILAHKTGKGWVILPGRTSIRRGDYVASPEPFKSTLQIASLNLTIELQPGAAVEYLGAGTDINAGFKIHRGRVSIKREAPDENAQPVTVGIRLVDEDCRFTINSALAECGLEVTPREPSRFEDDLSADPYIGSLFVIHGEATFKGHLAKPEPLSGPAWIPLGVKDRKALAAASSRPPLLTTPNWLDPDQSGMSSTVRRYAARYQKEIDPDLPLEHTVPAVVGSQVPRLAEFAVKTLVVTEQIPGLVEAMARAEYEEVRAAAITGLRQWLPQAAVNRDILKAEIEKHFPPDQVDPIYRLMWGYDDADARNQGASRLLVDWLKHENIVIRQLAILHIYRLTGQRYDYRPVDAAGRRKVAVERWEQHLKKNDDLLVK